MNEPSADKTREAWRARREERRAKQRAQNIVRARKMHEARLEYEQSHPLRLLKFDVEIPDSEKKARPESFIGCSGWYYRHWGDCFYPEGQRSSLWFSHYASQFHTVELNAPFYSWPTL